MWPKSWLLFILIGQNLSDMFNLESPDCSQFYWLTRSTNRTHHIVVFWPRFNAKQGYKEKASKGKGTWGKVQRKPAACFQEYFPSWITQDVLYFFQQQIVTTCMKCCLPRRLVRDSVPRFFVGAGHVVLFYLRTYQDSRLPERKQMFIINLVFSHSLGKVIYSYPEIWVPWCQRRVNLQAGLPKDISLKPAMLALHCTHASIWLQWKLENIVQPSDCVSSWNLGGLISKRKMKHE